MSSYHDMEMTWVWLMFTTGWWYTYPSEKYESNWDDFSQYDGKIKIVQTTTQWLVWRPKFRSPKEWVNCLNHLLHSTASHVAIAGETQRALILGQWCSTLFNWFPNLLDFWWFLGSLKLRTKASSSSALPSSTTWISQKKKNWGKLHLPSGGQTRQWDIVLKFAFKRENGIWGVPKMEAPKMDRL